MNSTNFKLIHRSEMIARRLKFFRVHDFLDGTMMHFDKLSLGCCFNLTYFVYFSVFSCLLFASQAFQLCIVQERFIHLVNWFHSFG